MAPTLQDNRDRIIQAARDAFVTEGYRCSIDKIAQLAGVAKQTVYNHFPTKENLFDEVTRANVSVFTVPLAGSPNLPRETLTEFGRAFRACVLSGHCLASMRTIISESQRMPGMAERSYYLGPEETMQRLAAYLKKCIEVGSLHAGDARFAADMLVGMLVGAERTRLLFGVTPEPFDEEARTAAIVDTFLRAFT